MRWSRSQRLPNGNISARWIMLKQPGKVCPATPGNRCIRLLEGKPVEALEAATQAVELAANDSGSHVVEPELSRRFTRRHLRRPNGSGLPPSTPQTR